MLDQVRKELHKYSSREKAKILQRFFKTGPGEYGEGDAFIGVVVPNIRKVCKKYQELSFKEIIKLLKSAIHEERLLALLILVLQYEKGDEKAKKSIYDIYMKNTKHINNWDLIDLSAHRIVGPYLLQKSKEPLVKFARSRSLWERRIAIISTFEYIRDGSFDTALQIARLLVEDTEDLIRKAVGWMLREMGKRDVKVEEKFLKKHYKKMPRTMLRYAIERFPEPKRKAYLTSSV